MIIARSTRTELYTKQTKQNKQKQTKANKPSHLVLTGMLTFFLLDFAFSNGPGAKFWQRLGPSLAFSLYTVVCMLMVTKYDHA